MEVEEDLSRLIDETVPENTKRSTKWGISVFDNYCARNSVVVDFQTVAEDELACVLKKFYASIRKKNGELYTPSALVGIRAALHRTISSPPFERNLNIIQGEKFTAANRIFTAKCKIYNKRGNPKPKHKPQISDPDMRKLGEYFRDYAKNPTKLIQYVWFGMCYHFGRR